MLHWRSTRKLLLIHDGASACAVPSGGLFWEKEPQAPDPAPGRILRVRNGGPVLALLPLGAGLAIDLRRLCRTMPFVLGELVATLGLRGAQELIASTAVVGDHDALTSLIRRHQLDAERLHLAGGWLEGVAPRSRDAEPLRDVPPVTRFSIRLSTAIDLELRRDGWIACVSSAPDVESAPRCAQARVGDQVVGEEPEHLPPWTEEDLLASLSVLVQLLESDPAQAVSFVDSLEPAPSETDLPPSARHVLAQFWHADGIARRTQTPEASIPSFDRALALAGETALRQELHYDRGYAWLEVTGRNGVPFTREPSRVASRFPRQPTEVELSCWRRALEDFTQAATLDDADATAWSQVGLSRLLLGSARYGARAAHRAEHLRAARDAFERAAARTHDPRQIAAMAGSASHAAHLLERTVAVPRPEPLGAWLRLGPLPAWARPLRSRERLALFLTLVQRAVADTLGHQLTGAQLRRGAFDHRGRAVSLDRLAADAAGEELEQWPTLVSERIALLADEPPSGRA